VNLEGGDFFIGIFGLEVLGNLRKNLESRWEPPNNHPINQTSLFNKHLNNQQTETAEK
jgi:hypothetical protein